MESCCRVSRQPTSWLCKFPHLSRFHCNSFLSSFEPYGGTWMSKAALAARAQLVVSHETLNRNAYRNSSQRILIPAGKAAPTPPVGPALGARGVKSMDFCKEFNARTSHVEPGVPTPTLITVQPDRSFTFITKTPPTSYFLKKAAGIEKGTGRPGHEIIGTISVKHVYEIAKIKQTDEHLKHLKLESIARSVIGTARTLGVQVVL